MSPVPAEWLSNGCMNLQGQTKDQRFSLTTRRYLEELHGNVPFRISGWPQRGYRHTLWWYEKGPDPASIGSFFVAFDHRRGPNLYAGVRIEKGFEDRELARMYAQRENKPLSSYVLTPKWDWHRFLKSLDDLAAHLQTAQESLGGQELFLWVEFHKEDARNRRTEESVYFVIRHGRIYRRGLLQPVSWKVVTDLIREPRSRLWGEVMIARAFGLGDARSSISEFDIWKVFEVLKTVRDSWRTSSTNRRTEILRGAR